LGADDGETALVDQSQRLARDTGLVGFELGQVQLCQTQDGSQQQEQYQG
jgi:hypothetical protein